jgi:16S rRNA (uracil1498-N3)-methyltransferase
MRSLHRFIVTRDCIDCDTVRITGGDAKQIANVLRLTPGDRIAAVDGTGSAMIVSLTEVSSAAVSGTIVEVCPIETEPRVRLTLAQSLPKGDRLELIIQKGTELGVANIEVVTSARTVARPPDDRVDKKLTRWQAIAKEAAEQSCRAVVPKVSGITPLAKFAERIAEFDLALLFWESEEHIGVKQVLLERPDIENLLVIVGPEGGFGEDEVRLLTAKGARAVSLGPRVLRCETAAIAAAAIVIYELEG